MQKIRLLTPIRSFATNRGTHYFIYDHYVKMMAKMPADLIMVVPGSNETYEALANMCDGLFLTGGSDIDAAYYHQENDEHNHLELPEIDQMDFDLVEIFRRLNKPILGICRGQQVINIAFGGTLIQDIPTLYNTSVVHRQSDDHIYTHQVNVEPDSTMYKFTQPTITVNSYHHQNIGVLAPGFKVMAYSEDGLIEAIEKDNIISVQWHPEKVEDEVQDQIVQMFLTKLRKEQRDGRENL